jgi:hypothetical protein
MIDTPVWLSILLMLPVVFATSLVSSFMRHSDFRRACRKTITLTVMISFGLFAISILSFCIHYLFCGGVMWK